MSKYTDIGPTEGELNEILEQHLNWLLGKPGGVRADLHGVNLCGADLRKANLREAILCGTILYKADLGGAYLYEADLSGADLRGADVDGAYLYKATLSKADLREANLCGTYLNMANLRGANLYGANLCGATLSKADLYRTNLRDANFRGADLSGATNVPYIPLTCPDEGSFIGWKKAGRFIVKLLIPGDAKRSSATGRKCRCSKAVVLEIQNKDGTCSGIDCCTSDFDSKFEYRVGEIVTVDNFCEDRWKECAPGIHFFVNRREAVDYDT